MSAAATHWGTWFAAIGVVAILGTLYVHERRETALLTELTRRVDELRLVQSGTCEKVDLHVNQPSPDVLAEAVASRVAARMGERNAKPSDLAGDSIEARSEEPEEPAVRTPEQQQLVAQATRVAESAIRTGRLMRSDVEELRSLFGRSGPAPEQIALRDRLIQAINEQKLVVEDPAFILF